MQLLSIQKYQITMKENPAIHLHCLYFARNMWLIWLNLALSYYSYYLLCIVVSRPFLNADFSQYHTFLSSKIVG